MEFDTPPQIGNVPLDLVEALGGNDVAPELCSVRLTAWFMRSSPYARLSKGAEGSSSKSGRNLTQADRDFVKPIDEKQYGLTQQDFWRPERALPTSSRMPLKPVMRITCRSIMSSGDPRM